MTMGRPPKYDNARLRYSRTKEGCIRKSYNNQVTSSQRRGHHLPKYTREQLISYAIRAPRFHELHDNWRKSGYKKSLYPSFDRIDDYQGYTLGNIRIVTWQENNERAYQDRKNGVNNKQSSAIIQMTMDGRFIAGFHSIADASRRALVNYGNLGQCIRGKRASVGGYRWMRSIGILIANNEEGFSHG